MSYSQNIYGKDLGPNSSSTYFSMDTQFGVFLKESFVFGPALNLNANALPFINPTTNLFERTHIYGVLVGVFARKYFPITEMFLFSLEGEILGGAGTDSYNSEEDLAPSMKVGLRPVFTFLPSEKWGFEAGVGELSYQLNPLGDYTNQDFFTANLGRVSLGVIYFLNRKSE